MRVIVYETTDPDVSEGLRFCARIRCPIPTKGGKLKDDWNPVVFYGSDAETLREQAEAWWDSELERAAAKRRPGRKPKEAGGASVAEEIVI